MEFFTGLNSWELEYASPEERRVLDNIVPNMEHIHEELFGYKCAGLIGFVPTIGVTGKLVVSRELGYQRWYDHNIDMTNVTPWRMPFQFLWVAVGYDESISAYRPKFLTRDGICGLLKSLVL